MTVRRHRHWYIATIGGPSAVSRDRLQAQHLVTAMLACSLHTPTKEID